MNGENRQRDLFLVKSSNFYHKKITAECCSDFFEFYFAFFLALAFCQVTQMGDARQILE